MEGINFVALDVETANRKRGSICAIGLAKFINGEIVGTYETLINPEEEFEGINIHKHKIKPEEVKNSPTYPKIVQDLIKFTDSLPVVMHNASFDSGSLRECNEKYGISDFYMEYFCSCQLSKVINDDIKNHGLKNLAKEFNIPLKHHDALSDAQASGLIILELVKKSNSQDLPQLFEKAYYHNLGVIKGFELGSRVISSQKSTTKYVNLVDKLDSSQLNKNHPFYRKYGVITGTLHSNKKEEAYQKFERVGGLRERKDPNITDKTNFLIMGEQDPKKLPPGEKDSLKIKEAKGKLAKGQDIELISEEEFLRMLQLPITEAEQDNLKKITSTNGFTFIIDDMSSDRDKHQAIYRGDNILLSRRKTLDPITPLFAKDAQTVRYENVLDITEPNGIERSIFQTLKAGQELTNEHKEYIKSNYVK